MSNRWFRGAVAVGCTIAAYTFTLYAQEAASPISTVSNQSRGPAVLQHVIAVQLTNVPIREALTTVASLAGVQLTYSPAQLPAGVTVSLSAGQITVGEALHAVLRGTGLDFIVLPSGRLAIGPKSAEHSATDAMAAQGSGTLNGVITDSSTQTPIAEVRVRIDGTTLEAKTGADGKYQITGVAAGDYRVTVRRVGYIAKTRSVSFNDGETKTLNFALVPPATQLNEVVTTALGEQRRYEVGNVIATINVDSLAPTVPATSVTDIISGRAPGVQILENGGLVGSGEAIRIRGETSLLLQGDPILIVDGMRQDASAGGTTNLLFDNYSPSPSRINDLDFTQIETIDILKGPAAAAEYGTDAANGVIVITTKRGRAGPAQWHATADHDAIAAPGSFPEYYSQFSHLTDGTDRVAGACSLAGYGEFTPYEVMTMGGCIMDSVIHFNPLNHSRTSLFNVSGRSSYDLDVSGGSEIVRYYLAGSLGNTTGNTHLPDVFRSQAEAMGLPESDFSPNSLNQRSVKGNTTIKLSANTDAQINVTYTSTFQKTPSTGLTNALLGSLGYPVIGDSAHYWGYSSTYGSPLADITETASQETDAIDAGGQITWRPLGWLTGHITLGLQHEAQQGYQVVLPQALSIAFGGPPTGGEIANTNTDVATYTADFRLAAIATLTSALKSTTSFGIQIVDNRTAGVTAFSVNLAAGQLTYGPNSYGNASNARQATLGGYLEEELALSERLFLNVAFRLDAGSGFGSSYSVQPYTKGSVSYLLVSGSSTTVRLRGALGGAGIQPPYGAALQTYGLGSVLSEAGSPVNSYGLQSPGTPGLQPERTMEYEGGFDIGLWRNRVSIEVTDYSKITQNAIYGLPLGYEFGYETYYENLGEVTNNGFETTIAVTAIDTRPLNWTVTVNGSINTNKLVHLAPGIQTAFDGQDAGDRNQRFTVGYPLYGYWGNDVHYVDHNHDGILEIPYGYSSTANDVYYDSLDSYQGSSTPKEEISVSSHIGLWRNFVTIGTLFDYQGDFKLLGAGPNGAYQYIIGEPYYEQANVAYPYNGVGSVSGSALSFQNASFLRWRELSLTVALPNDWARTAHVHSMGITGAVRNLNLWTKFQGADPESGGANISTYQPSSASFVVNNDLRESIGNIPLMRQWTIRLNLSL